MKIERAVTVNVEAAHYDRAGKLHGHSYLVECWTDKDMDLPQLEAIARADASHVDHTELGDAIGAPTMEALGEWFLANCDLYTRIVVRRPTLGFVVEVVR